VVEIGNSAVLPLRTAAEENNAYTGIHKQNKLDFGSQTEIRRGRMVILLSITMPLMTRSAGTIPTWVRLQKQVRNDHNASTRMETKS